MTGTICERMPRRPYHCPTCYDGDQHVWRCQKCEKTFLTSEALLTHCLRSHVHAKAAR